LCRVLATLDQETAACRKKQKGEDCNLQHMCQEQQRAGCLVDECAELLCRVRVTPDQPAGRGRRVKTATFGVCAWGWKGEQDALLNVVQGLCFGYLQSSNRIEQLHEVD